MERKIKVFCGAFVGSCGEQLLSSDGYMQQLTAANRGWWCPKCGRDANWMGIEYQCPMCGGWNSEENEAHCEHCNKCMACEGTGKVEDTDDGLCPMCPPPGWEATNG